MKMKRALALLLAATMVVGATGCMQKGGNGSKKKAERKAVAVPEDIWAPYEEEVEIHTIMSENTGIQWEEGDDYDNNPWYREYKKRFNIQMVNDWVSSDYSTKRNLSIAENNIPDVFNATYQQVKELKDADMIQDMTEIFEKYASPRVKELRDKNQGIFEAAKVDGKLYSIPQLNQGDMGQANVVWVRSDWKKESGVEDISTVEGFEKMAKTIAEKHGSYAITETDSLMSMKAMAPAWGAYPDIWVEQEDGTIGYGTIQPEMKDVLETYARWFKEGMLDPEFITCDPDKMFMEVNSEKVGVCPFSDWFIWGCGPTAIENLTEDQYYDAYPIPTVNGELPKLPVSFSNYGNIVVSKDCPNPEAIVKLINYFVELKAGALEDMDTKTMDSLMNLGTIPYSVRMFDTNEGYDTQTKVWEALQKDKSEVDVQALGGAASTYNDCMKVIENKDPAGGGLYFGNGREKSSAAVGKLLIDNNMKLEDKLWGPPTETLGKMGSQLDTILLEGFTKIITGEQPVDYFDTLVEDWKAAGGEQATKEVNEIYGK